MNNQDQQYADYLADCALKTQSKWSVVATDILTGKVVDSDDRMSSSEAWSYFDYLRSKHGACKSICRGGYHFCVDVVIAFDGVGEKSSIWS